MEKKFAVFRPNQMTAKTYEDAEKTAKRLTGLNNEEFIVVQAIVSTVVPTPEIEVVKLS